MSTLGNKILKLLNEKNLTQKELAKMVGTTEVSIGRYVNDKRDPSASMLSDIANALNVSTDYLLGRTSNPHKTLTPIEEEFEDPEIKILARKARSLTPEQLKAVQAVIDSYERNKKNDEVD